MPIQYADYAVWQRDPAYLMLLEHQISYWKEQLANAPATLALHTDYPRSLTQTFNGAVHTFILPDADVEQLKYLCREEGVTLFMALLAVFTVVLYRHTHQNDLVIGSPIAQRNRPEIENLLGFFVNTLVLRIQMTPTQPFRELLQQVRQLMLGAYTHQDVPFDMLVEELHVQRVAQLHPLFQILFDFQDVSATKLELADLTV